ncbi:MAG: hypothetical protein LIO46_00290 [Clostridiales bacterium]|nr:hypothetical protein [Clostridiales bacterium]
MVATIQVALEQETTASFIRSLHRNLDQAEAARVLEWTRDHEDNFHTRIHFGQATVALHTAQTDGGSRFHSLVIQAVTQPLDSDNADYLIAIIGREELGDAAGLADDLVARLEQSIPSGRHHISRILDKFIAENKA